MNDRRLRWAAIPLGLALVLDLALLGLPAWDFVLGGFSAAGVLAAFLVVAVPRRRNRQTPETDLRSARLTSLSNALIKFSAGDMTVTVTGEACSDPQVEACIQEFNDVTAEPSHRQFYVGSDSLVEGTMAGRAIGAKLGKGRLAILVGSLDGVNFQLRRKAALSELRDHYPDVHESALVESRVDPNWAYDQVTKLLASDPALGAIYVTEGGTPGAVAKAVADAGKAGKVLVFGHDVTPATMEAMDKGWVAATIFQDPFAQGYDPVVRLFNLVGAGETPQATRYVTKVRSVAPENRAEFWDSAKKVSRAGDLSRLVVPRKPRTDRRPRIAVVGLANDGFWAEVKAGALAAQNALAPLGGTVEWLIPAGADEPERITNVGQVIRTVIAGHYDAVAVPVHSRSILGPINEAVAAGVAVATFNSEPLSFRQTLATVTAEAKLQLSVSRDLDEQAVRGASSAEQIGASLGRVNQGLGRQKQQVEQTGSDLETLGTTLGTIDSAARTSAAATQSVTKAAGDSFQAVEDSLGAMVSLEASSRAIATSVEELNKETDRIAENVSFIGDIANQTNTLAINASIEAARNGVAGRGFAVIAAEIRSLSDQADRAAATISTLLASVSAKVKLVETTTQQSFERTRKTHELASRSQEALGLIRSAAEASELQMGQILGAVQQVVGFRSQIANVVAILKQTNEDWDLAVGQSLTATSEMTEAVGRIAQAAKLLSERSTAQEGMLRQFKLEEE
jgi:methyl-accepting chemotaxis protein